MMKVALSQTHVAIVIVNYNAGEWLARSVQSVADQTHTDFTCVIVDNGSDDGSIASLPKLDKRFIVKELGDNKGFALASNIGAHIATQDRNDTEWVAMLNPDAFARTDWLEKLLEATTLEPNVTMVGSTQIMALEQDKFDGLGDYYHVSGLAWRAGFGHDVKPNVTREAFGPCGAGAMYHYPSFEKLGGYDAAFFCYHEDVDLAYRMRLDGGICLQSSEAVIDHISSGISGQGSDFAVYHGTRNRIWTFYKNTPFPLILLLMPVHVAMNMAMVLWALFRGNRLAPTWRGVKDGFSGLSNVKAQRRETMKHHKTVSAWTLLKSFAWSPKAVVSRGTPKVQTFQKPVKSAS